ncbi:MAG TPA: macro domain-containing protein [Thermodesulfobacteriota bacterium]
MSARRIEVVVGDLTEQAVDAIVNAANTELELGAGVAGAIRKKGGPTIQAACRRIGPIPLGEAAVTEAGRLPVRHVIHAASMGPSMPTTEASLRDAVRNSLLRCVEYGIRTVAFPAIGTGVAGFPMARCAEIMVDTVQAHLARNALPEQVRFVLLDEAAAAHFRAQLG